MRSHLRFVLDNLAFDAISNRDRITYLITAFENNEVEEDEDQEDKMAEDIHQISV